MGSRSSEQAKASLATSPSVWIALAVAFSPVLIDLARHLLAAPWARGALVFPWLVWLAARVDRPAGSPPLGRHWVGLALGAALVLQVVAIGGDAVRVARVGLVLAAALALWGTGTVGLRSAILALWILPVPSFVMEALSPNLEVAVARLAALGPAVSVGTTSAGDPALSTAAGSIELAPIDGGIALALGLAGVQWARSTLGGRSLGACAGAAVLGALIAVPLQVVLLLSASGLVAAGLAPTEVARSLLDQAGAVLVAASGLALPWLRPVPGAHAPSRSRGQGSLAC